MPLRHASADCARRQARCRQYLSGEGMMIDFLSTRREFLKGGGAVVVSFAIAARHASVIAQTGTGVAKSVAADEVDTFLAIGADGKVTVYSAKADLGTALHTGPSHMRAAVPAMQPCLDPSVPRATRLTAS